MVSESWSPSTEIESFIELLADMVLLIRPSDGRILGANTAAVVAYAYDKRELLQRTIRDLRAPETAAQIEASMAQANVSGSRFETIHQRKGGERFPVEVNSRGFFDGDTRILLSVVRDISDKHRMLDALREAERQRQAEFEVAEQRLRFFKTAIDRAPFCAYWLDSLGRCVYVNDAACRTLGYTRDELLAMRIIDIARGSDELWQRIFDSIKAEGSTTMRSRHYRSSGEAVDVEITSFLLNYEGNDYSIGFAVDITEGLSAERERETLQRQFNQAQKMESIGRLAGGIAHDFNNVLLSIQLCTEDMLQQVATEPFREDLALIENATKRASALTRQLLTFARRQAIAPQVLELNEAVAGAVRMLRPLLGANLELEWHPHPNLAYVLIDPSQLDQLLTNLCVNARDAIKDVGKVIVRTARRTIGAADCLANPGFAAGEFVELSVTDNGCGMDATTLSSIFEPFFTTKPEGQGTGLGLATVYGIVKQNGGFIGVSSTVGEGTSFSIYLPSVTGRAAGVKTAMPARRTTVGSATILVVEDDPTILELVTRGLRREGHVVLAAASPLEAIRASAEYQGAIHLMLTDVILPQMNGRELSKKVCAARPALKCLFMSGYTADIMGFESVIEPSFAYIQKPFAIEALLAKVRLILEKSCG